MRNLLIAVVTVTYTALSSVSSTVAFAKVEALAMEEQAPASGYLLPPKAIIDILDALPPPAVQLSPAKDVVALLDRASMPTIAQLSQPMHRLAGVRINPRTNGPHRTQSARAITLKSIADGVEKKVTVPANPMLSWIGFSKDGKRFAFTQQRDNGIELWVGDTATGQARSITPAQLNAALGSPCEWVGEGGSLLCAFVSPSRGAAPVPGVPTGPNIQEHRGGVAPVRTYQDLLASSYDEALFDYYATSQLAFVDATSGQRTPVSSPAVFVTAAPSPDGQHILVRRVKRPYSWLVPYQNFAASVEVWDRQGAAIKQIAQLPVADNVPNGGVLPGPRSFQWQPLAPATLVFTEALDNGDPKAKVPHRDKIVTMSAPFSAAASELARTGTASATCHGRRAAQSC